MKGWPHRRQRRERARGGQQAARRPTSTLGARANDSYISSKVRPAFVDQKDFHVQQVKVVTEAGTTYLMGLVSQREGDAATEIARTTKGVQKVVRVFGIHQRRSPPPRRRGPSRQ